MNLYKGKVFLQFQKPSSLHHKQDTFHLGHARGRHPTTYEIFAILL